MAEASGGDVTSTSIGRSRRPGLAASSLCVATAALMNAAPSDAAEVLPEMVASFNLATFSPQVFWLLMILAPTSPVTRAVMGSWIPVILAASIHFFVDSVGFTQPGALEEAAKFGQVFDPTIPPTQWASGEVTGPLEGFRSMLENPNFVTEEWAHVLTWDLFVGRWMWLDALARDVPFLGPSLLLTNFTGPPGLILYFLVCLFTGKGLPSVPEPASSTAASKALPSMIPAIATTDRDAGALVAELWSPSRGGVGWSAEAIVAACAEDVLWEDLSGAGILEGRAAVFEALKAREARDARAGATLVTERTAPGRAAAGFTWHRARQGEKGGVAAGRGLRGTTFVELDADGRVAFVREAAEPIVKPGGATADLLKAIAKPPIAPLGRLESTRVPTSASDLVAYLWKEVQGCEGFRSEALNNFADDIVYEDLNFEVPFVGKSQVGTFLEEFDIPGLTFVPDKASDGDTACVFTWEVDLGMEGSQRVKGISFYECEPTGAGGVRVTYVRDIPESVLKPPPVQALAGIIDPALRVLTPAPPEADMVAAARQ